MTLGPFPLLRLAGLLLLAGGGAAHAQTAGSEDTRLRLDQGIERRSAEREARLIEAAGELDAPPISIEIDGTTYAVGNDVDQMGQALYVAVARHQWADVRRFLKPYLAFADHDPLLVLYAEGALARQAGDLRAAEAHYRALLGLRADFLPARLELARVLFEDRQDREALRAFRDARAIVEAEGEKGAGVRKTIDGFIAALAQRRGWHGSLAIGPGYSSNLNQSSAGYTCLLADDDGTCLIDRTMPAPIGAAGVNFEATLGRRVPLGGHSGIMGRALLYGDVYARHSDFSQATLSTQIGYDRRAARSSVTLSPTFDLGSLGSGLLYRAWGVRAEATVDLSAKLALRLEASRKDFDYRQSGYRDHDGPLTEAYLTGWYAPAAGWTLFGGPDFSDKNTRDPVNAYRQYGVRGGVARQFGTAANLLLLASSRRRDYDAYSELLEAKRRDREQNYTAILKLPALAFAGLTPSLLVQHNRVESNVDWLYSYRRTAGSVRLEHAF